ncbi:aminotransferase class I/II-fold pyridoxal phosphate-dependent enzyme [Pontibacter vulgaris]|uniref:aminotransferase class I/II-fold pyridoxal phosphate-dependent enzyme n=1 Tax=Pontibacter vulgaris TaxID=2905679 RepID=UPI001FA80937|nr:aminotransferase class I/II-fold pyridoxal phosphate-dependent enzyme [Pontibacter vulgaris]
MDYIKLASGASYFQSPEPAIEAAIKALRNGATSYGPTEGIPELRQAIAERYQEENIALTPEQVLVTPGSKQALFNVLSVLLNEGDEVIVPVPAWFGFHELLKYSKGVGVALNTSPEDNYTITPEALKQVLNERSRLLILTNPGNPMGRLYSKKELEAILKVTAAYPDLYVLNDEIYDCITYDRPFTSILSCEGANEKTIVINGFSKSFAMSGWRIGYIAGATDLIKKCIAFQASTMSGISLFSQQAAVATLLNRQSALAPILKILKENRALMQQALEELPHVNYTLPEGAYYFFPDFTYYINSKTPAGQSIKNGIALCNYFRDYYSLELAPGDNFGAVGFARMSFAVEKDKLKEASKRLKLALSTLQH